MLSLRENTHDGGVMRYRRSGNLRLPVWSTFTIEGIIPQLESLLAEGLRLAYRVGTKKDPTFHDVVTRFEEIEERIARLTAPLIFLADAAAAEYPGIIEVKNTVDVLLAKYYLSLNLRKGLYLASNVVLERPGFSKLPQEEQYILSRQSVSLKALGVELGKSEKQRLRKLYVMLTELENRFQKNVQDATDGYTIDVVDKKMLSGIPEELQRAMQARAAKAGKPGYAISLKDDDFMTVMEFADVRSLRQRLWRAFHSRASKIGPSAGLFDNAPVICKILEIRHEIANLLGYEDYTAHSIGFMMADKVHIVDSFLERLAAATKRKSKREDRTLRKFAHKELGLAQVYSWDRAYVARIHREKLYGIDSEIVRSYFPVDNVLAGLSGFAQRLFGCTLVEKKVTAWHQEVRFFEVHDAKGKTLGGFYVDLYSRPGKASGAWAMNLMARHQYKGSMQYSIAAIVANFRPPVEGVCTTLTHEDMVTLFHEFGHVLHLIFGKTKHRESIAFFVEWDAVEMPSQLLEAWCWKKDMLREISGHKDTGEPIPDVLLDAIVSSRYHNVGREYAYRVTRALFDWNIHRTTVKDESTLLRVYRESASQADAVEMPRSLRAPHIFTHIFSWGYAAGYYGYLWADSLVADMLAAFKRAGKAGEADVARRYRKEILAKGSSRLFAESFRAFRGRGPRMRFLLRHLGLEE